MSSSSVPLWTSAAWIALTLLTFPALDASSLWRWVLATTIGLMPPFALLRPWSEDLPPTVVEVLHAAEDKR